MLLGSRPTPERAEIAASAGLWILLAGVKPVLAWLQLPDHGWSGGPEDPPLRVHV